MSSVVIAGNTSGTVTLDAPDVAGSTVLTLPATSGTIVAPSSAGTSGQVLTSNGAGSSPTYQDLPAGGVTSLNGQTGAITNTDYGAIGSYVIASENNFTASQERLPNVTVAGSSLIRSNLSSSSSNISHSFNTGANSTSTISATSNAFNTSLSLSGTWRRLTRSMNPTNGAHSAANLYVRIS